MAEFKWGKIKSPIFTLEGRFVFLFLLFCTISFVLGPPDRDMLSLSNCSTVSLSRSIKEDSS